MAAIRTEYPFVLPRGFVDDDGAVHRRGVMRLATARDEIEPLRDPRVTDPEDPLLTVLVLARVVTRIGEHSDLTPRDIENLFAVDLAYLQDFYGVINFGSEADLAAVLEAAQAGSDVGPAGSEGDPDEGPEAPAREHDAAEAGNGATVQRRGRAAIEEVPTGER